MELQKGTPWFCVKSKFILETNQYLLNILIDSKENFMLLGSKDLDRTWKLIQKAGSCYFSQASLVTKPNLTIHFPKPSPKTLSQPQLTSPNLTKFHQSSSPYLCSPSLTKTLPIFIFLHITSPSIKQALLKSPNLNQLFPSLNLLISH